MQKLVLTAVVSLAVAGSTFAAGVLQVKSVADISEKVSSVKNIANGIKITSKGYTQFHSAKRIPIDFKKKYRITCEYRMTPGSQTEGFFYIAPVSFDKNKKRILPAPQFCVRGTDTVLAAAAPKGAKVIKIKNGAKWIKNRYVAFNAKKDFSDLPNNDTVRVGAVAKKGDIWEVELKAPLAKAYPAGTAVREHTSGMTYRYLLYAKPQKEWKKVSHIYQGAKAEHVPGYQKTWRLGTVNAGLLFFTTNKPIDMEIRELSITEVK